MPDPGPGGRLSPPAVTNGRIDDAVEAVRMGARGRSRAETRALLVAELRARGIMSPPPSVDLLVDYVAGGPAQRLAFQVRQAGLALRFLSAAIRHRPLPAWDVTATRIVPSSLPVRPTEVILSGDASQHLAVGDADIFEVWLTLVTPGSAPGHGMAESADASDHLIAVFRGEYQVGALDSDASAAWRPLLHESREVSQTVVTFATRKQADTGEWRLLVGLPLP